VLLIPANAGNAAGQRAVVEPRRQTLGGIDILFVNAGIAELLPVEQWEEAAFDRSFAINVKGPYFLVQALLPIFANPASIVLNASVNAHIGMSGTSVYGATKAALLSLSRTLSTDRARHPRECSQPWSNIDAPLRQARPFRSRFQDRFGIHPKQGSGRTLRNPSARHYRRRSPGSTPQSHPTSIRTRS